MRLRHQLEATVRRFYDGCNTGSDELLRSCLTEDAVHYFPVGSPFERFGSAGELVEGWRAAIRRFDSRWTLDRLVIDEHLRTAVVEWTHFRPATGGWVRGAEICVFADDGRIREIRPYYAVPAGDPSCRHELAGFDYEGRGYATEPPDVTRSF
jgi:hypothetical protein